MLDINMQIIEFEMFCSVRIMRLAAGCRPLYRPSSQWLTVRMANLRQKKQWIMNFIVAIFSSASANEYDEGGARQQSVSDTQEDSRT